jgi:hypothetical protein
MKNVFLLILHCHQLSEASLLHVTPLPHPLAFSVPVAVSNCQLCALQAASPQHGGESWID